MTENPLIPYEEMLKSGMHFGRKKTVFHPAMGKYVFTVRDGICIIDLLKTQTSLEDVVASLAKTVEEGKIILFYAPTKQSQETVQALAEKLNMPYVTERWLGGTLTNFKIINARVKRLEEMERQKANSELNKYTKKERLMFDRELIKMQSKFHGLKRLTRMPDVVFVSSLKEGKLAIDESKRMNVPVISISNTDSNPVGLQFVIPANDRSKKSVDLIVETIHNALVSR